MSGANHPHVDAEDRSFREDAGAFLVSPDCFSQEERGGPQGCLSYGRFVPFAFLAIILSAGLWLRMSNLTAADFNIDEVLHAFAAQQLVEGNDAVLPSGLSYSRGLLYTKLVALAGAAGRIDEWAVRMPSVIFGSLTILLVFLIGRTFYSDAAGLVAASITAVAPMQVAFSREGRMYAMFQFFYLLFVFVFFLALESAPKMKVRGWIPVRWRNWCTTAGISPLMFIAAAGALVAAKHLHNLAVLAALGPAVYVLTMAGVGICRRGVVRPWKYVALSLICIVSALTYARVTDAWTGYLWLRTYTPEWAANNTGDTYYVRALATSFPVMLPGLLLTAAIAVTRNTKATLYLLISFGVPLVLQSLFFTWKHERYILHIIPLMFILFGAGASWMTALVYHSLRGWAGAKLHPAAARLSAWTLTAFATLFFLSFMPWARDGFAVPRRHAGTVAGVYHHNWRAATQYVSARLDPSEFVIASAPGLARYYGVRAPMYYLANDTTDRHLEAGLKDQDGRPMDYIAGVPMVLHLQALEQILRTYGSGWIVGERFRFQGSRPLPTDIVAFIESHCRSEEVPDARTMMVWHCGGAQ